MADDSLNILLFKPVLDNSTSSTQDLNSQIKQLQQKLESLKLSGQFDPKMFSDLSAQIKGIEKQLGDSLGNNIWIEKFGGNLRSAITKVQNEAKQGLISLDQLETKLLDISKVYGQAGAFDGNLGIKNTKAMTDALLTAEKQRTDIIKQEQSTRINIEKDTEKQKESIEKQYTTFLAAERKREYDIDRAHYLALVDDAKRANAEKKALDKEYVNWWSSTMKEIETIDKAHYMALTQNSAINAAQQKAQQDAMLSRGTVRDSITNTNTGFSTGKAMVSLGLFSGVMGAYSTMVQGMKDIENGAAGLEQVLSKQLHSQDDLNKVTNDFIGIAKHYGESVNDVLDGAKLWGRQYKDVNEVMTLTNASTLLSVVDNLKLTDANRGLEATMNSMGMAAKTQAEAFAYSMKMVDSWSKLAHEASVSANDLVKATENSAGAAHQVGVNFDQLQALITSGVRNTGLEGANVGNMLKSLFASIQTDKSEKALKQLDIAIKQVGANGQQEYRPVFDVLLELSQKLQTTDKSQQKLIETVSGGKYQWSKVASMLSDYNTIIDGYAVSLNSAGSAQAYAEIQMHTLSREVQRLKDTFIELSAQTDQNGLGELLKTIVRGINDLIVGLEKMPAGVGDTIAVIGGLVLGLKTMSALMVGLEPLAARLITIFPNIAKGMTVATVATEAEIVATGGLTAAFTALDVVSGGLALVIGGLVAGFAAYTISQGEAANKTQDHNQALQDKIGLSLQDLNLQKQKQQFMDTAIKQEEQLKKQLDDGTLSTENRNKITEDLINLYHAVGKATGDTALQQVNASNVHNVSLQSQREAIAKLVEAKNTAYKNSIEANNKQIQSDIDAANQKINASKKVIEALKAESEARMSEMTLWQKIQYALMSNPEFGGSQDLATQYAKDIKDKKLAEAQADYAKLQNDLGQLQTKLQSNNLDLAKIDTSPVDDLSKSLGVVDSTSTTTNQSVSALQKAIDAVNDSIQKTQNQQQMYAKSSQQYRDSVQSEIDLLKQKRDLLQQGVNNPSLLEPVKSGGKSATSSSSVTSGSKAQYNGAFDILINEASQKYNVDPNLIAAVMKKESTFNADAHSEAGAIGLMQLMPGTASDLGVDPYNVHDNVMGGVKYLSQMLKQFGDINLALAGYNAGPGNAEWALSNHPETMDYVPKVLQYYSEFQSGSASVPTSVATSNTTGFTDKSVYDKGKQAQQEIDKITSEIYKKQLDKFDSTLAEYDLKFADFDLQYKMSQSIADRYTKTSSEYRAELANQVDILAKKQVLMHDEAEAIRNSGLNSDQLTNKLKSLSSSWWDLQKSIETSHKEIQNSQVDELIQTISTALDPYNEKIKELTKNVDSLRTTDEQKHQSQVELIYAYKDEQKEIEKNISKLEDQSKTLDKDSDAWKKNQQELIKYKDLLGQTSENIQATNNKIKNEIVDKLKQSYDIEKKLQDQQLKDSYDATIKPLKDEKDRIDDKIKSLQEEWRIKQDLFNLANLQNQLNAEMSLKNHEYIDASGQRSYTYDVSKVTDLQRQIQNERIKQERDTQKIQLEEDKRKLDDQIKQETESYNTRKEKLDQYWAYRLSADQLNKEADYMIAHEGYQNALKDADDFFTQMNKKWEALQTDAINAGNGIAKELGLIVSTLSGDFNSMIDKSKTSIAQLISLLAEYGKQWSAAKTQAEQDAIHKKADEATKKVDPNSTYDPNTGERVSSGGIILNGPRAGQSSNGGSTSSYLQTLTPDQLQARKESNSQKWFNQSDADRAKSHAENEQIMKLLDPSKQFDSNSGSYLPHYKDGGWIAEDQIAQLHGQEEVIGQKQTASIMNKYGVKPSEILANLSKFIMPQVSLPSMESLPQINNNTNNEFTFTGNLVFPSVKNGDDARGFTKELFQRAYHNSLAGGMS